MTLAARRGESLARSMWEPVHLGVDEAGRAVRVRLAGRHLVSAGEPGAGKSNLLQLVTAHGAMSPDCRLVLIDGKQVELGMWRDCADVFVGPSITDAIDALHELRTVMDARYARLLAEGRRGVGPADGAAVLLVVDELAYFSATVGEPKQQREFTALVRDLVARGRAAGIVAVLATQRPSADIIPTSLRDLVGYRLAFRCTTNASSDVVLGNGWASAGYTAAEIDPLARGVGWLLAEDGRPRRIKTAYLSDRQAAAIARYAAAMRTQHRDDRGDGGQLVLSLDGAE